MLAHPHPKQVGPVVLTDFGTSILPWDPRAVHGLCGTLDYHPPELALTDLKFAAELQEPDSAAALPSPDSSSSRALLTSLSMDPPTALQRAASALFDEKMDVWGLGMLLYECLAEHLPLEAVTDTNVILSRVATGTGMASAAPTFALLPCHKAVLALCQWVTAPRPADRPSAREVHAAAAGMLLELCASAAGSRGLDGGGAEVLACGEVLTLGRASRVHAPAAAGWTDALIAAAPLARPGEVSVHPRLGIVAFGGARPSPEAFAGALPEGVAQKVAALAAQSESGSELDGRVGSDEFVDAPEARESADGSSSPGSAYEAGSHAVFDDFDSPRAPRPRRMFGALIDTLLLAGAGFGYGGAVSAAAAPCNSCDGGKRTRGAGGARPPCSEPGVKRATCPAAAAISFAIDSPRIGACLGGATAVHGGVIMCGARSTLGCAGSIPLLAPPVRCASPPSARREEPRIATPRPCSAVLPVPSTPPPAPAGALVAAPGPPGSCGAAYAPVAAFLPTLTAIPSITESDGGSLDATCGSPRPSPMKAADCVAHDIMETTTSCGSSDESGFEVCDTCVCCCLCGCFWAPAHQCMSILAACVQSAAHTWWPQLHSLVDMHGMCMCCSVCALCLLTGCSGTGSDPPVPPAGRALCPRCHRPQPGRLPRPGHQPRPPLHRPLPAQARRR